LVAFVLPSSISSRQLVYTSSVALLGAGKVRTPCHCPFLIAASAVNHAIFSLMPFMQTTLAAELSKKLSVPSYSFDALFWRPGWSQAPVEEFQTSVKKLVEDHHEGWIIDGDYDSKLGEVASWLEEQATDVICESLPGVAL
jgi:hypothetical protein